MNAFSDAWIASVQGERDADDYEKRRSARARRAHERGLIDAREFEREKFEAIREANNMRAKVIASLLQFHSK